MGLDVRIEMLKHRNPLEKEKLAIGATRLTHPQQMGTLFKVMAVFSPPSLIPIGFEE
jgi:SAM-dependent MidA family methyltransferase